MGGNTVSETFRYMFSEVCEVFRKLARTSQFGASWLSMGGKGALNYLPMVPKASIYVPKIMSEPVMGGNTMSETFTHMFLFLKCVKFRKLAHTVNLERDG